jgi:hypothetical protein
MTVDDSPRVATPATQPTAGVANVFAGLVGLIALAFLAQGLLAGLFLRYDGQRDASKKWIDAHANVAHVAFGLSLILAVLAIAKLRQRTDLMVGAVTLAVLIGIESYIGGAIVDNGKDSWTAIHVPIAMALMGVATWLALKAAQLRRATR